MRTTNFWEILADYNVDGLIELDKQLTGWLNTIFEQEVFQRAMLLDSIRSLGVPFEKTNAYKLFTVDMLKKLLYDVDDVIELEINKNGILSLLISSEYVEKLFKGEDTEILYDFMNSMVCVFIVDTDFFVNYGYNAIYYLKDRINIVAVQLGNKLKQFKALDIPHIFSCDSVTIMDESVHSFIRGLYRNGINYTLPGLNWIGEVLDWFNAYLESDKLTLNFELSYSDGNADLVLFRILSCILHNRHKLSKYDTICINWTTGPSNVRLDLFSDLELIHQCERTFKNKNFQVNLVCTSDIGSNYVKNLLTVKGLEK